ncbi:MAG: response regulator transcription factor [Bacteroidota bacterium]
MKILLIEDEPAISGFIKKGLEENGFTVTQAFDGEMSLRLASKDNFDVMIFDLILPGMNGLELTQHIREKLKIKTPILMLTALNETEDIVKGLNAGADDYMGKPFKFQELLARLRALSRRPVELEQKSNQLEAGDLIVDLDRKTVHRAGQELKLTAKEFFLLTYLLRNKNRVVSRMDILENVWDIQFDLGTNVVDVYVNYLRKKIDKPFEEKLIRTVTGMGYMLEYLPEEKVA